MASTTYQLRFAMVSLSIYLIWTTYGSAPLSDFESTKLPSWYPYNLIETDPSCYKIGPPYCPMFPPGGAYSVFPNAEEKFQHLLQNMHRMDPNDSRSIDIGKYRYGANTGGGLLIFWSGGDWCGTDGTPSNPSNDEREPMLWYSDANAAGRLKAWDYNTCDPTYYDGIADPTRNHYTCQSAFNIETMWSSIAGGSSSTDTNRCLLFGGSTSCGGSARNIVMSPEDDSWFSEENICGGNSCFADGHCDPPFANYNDYYGGGFVAGMNGATHVYSRTTTEIQYPLPIGAHYDEREKVAPADVDAGGKHFVIMLEYYDPTILPSTCWVLYDDTYTVLSEISSNYNGRSKFYRKKFTPPTNCKPYKFICKKADNSYVNLPEEDEYFFGTQIMEWEWTNLASYSTGYDCDEQHYYNTGTEWIVNGGPTITNTNDIWYYHNGGTCRGCQYIPILLCWQQCIENNFASQHCNCDTPAPAGSNTPSPTSVTISPTSITASPTSITPSPTSNTASPTSVTASPTTNTGSPTTNTGVPTSVTSSPTANTGSPTSATGSPTTVTIAPTPATISPTINTASPTDATPSPSADTISPTNNTPSPIGTPAPTPVTESPTTNTASPTDATPSPTAATDSPTLTTGSPTNNTPSPTSMTGTPTINTPSPTDAANNTPSPTDISQAPSDATTSPTPATNSPTPATNSPTTATNSPTTATDSPTLVTPSPTLVTPSPTLVTSSPTSVSSSPTLATPSPNTIAPSTAPTVEGLTCSDIIDWTQTFTRVRSWDEEQDAGTYLGTCEEDFALAYPDCSEWNSNTMEYFYYFVYERRGRGGRNSRLYVYMQICCGIGSTFGPNYQPTQVDNADQYAANAVIVDRYKSAQSLQSDDNDQWTNPSQWEWKHYTVYSIIIIIITCCIIGGLWLIRRRMIRNKEDTSNKEIDPYPNKTRGSKRNVMENTIQMHGFSQKPGPKHIALPSAARDSTDGSTTDGFGATTNSQFIHITNKYDSTDGSQQDMLAPPMQKLGHQIMASVSIDTPEVKPIDGNQNENEIDHQPLDIGDDVDQDLVKEYQQSIKTTNDIIADADDDGEYEYYYDDGTGGAIGATGGDDEYEYYEE